MIIDETTQSTQTAIYVADPVIQPELLGTIRASLPSGWSIGRVLEGASVILTENVDVSEEMLTAAGEQLRLVARLEAGSAAVAPTGLPIIDLPDPARLGVAEHAITLILTLSRHLFWVTNQTADERWVPGRDRPILTDQQHYTYNWIGLADFGMLYRKTVGIVGLGYVGRAVAQRLRPFGVRLLYTDVDRFDGEEARLGVEWRTLEDLLQESDFVTLHHVFVEGPQGNDKQFSAREFDLMKSTAYFINTSRGRMVDEEALVKALRSGKIAGAGLDVFRYEPLPAGHPLFELTGNNVILTPHVAGTPDAQAQQTVADELIERVRGVL
jgi:phosphoglycerate dehydrogenase-like enzyme